MVDAPKRASLLRHRPFAAYLSGTVLSQVGTEGTFVAVLYHAYVLTSSTFQVGLIGLSRGATQFIAAPLGGYLADRLDRRTLLQLSQILSMANSFTLAYVTVVGALVPWHLIAFVLLQGTLKSFDGPSRKAIIPAIVPDGELIRGLAIVNPMDQAGKLAGPAVAGALIAAGGPQLMYLLDGFTFIALIVVLGFLRIPRLAESDRAKGLWSSLGEGAKFIVRKPLLVHLIALDFVAVLYTAYRAVLPALALDVLEVGPSGYGLLASGPPAGALIGGAVAYRLIGTRVTTGWIPLSGTVVMGLGALVLAHSQTLLVGLVGVGLLGFGDSIATVVRHGVLLLETPDRLRGRVSALYSVFAGTGPPLGEFNIGWLAGLLGVTAALTLGGGLTIATAIGVGVFSSHVRTYRAGATRTAEDDRAASAAAE